jgi:FKBP-type peptidyl-prolyl cis-trans isomerase (trigger factor)
VYPEVKLGDVATAEIERTTTTISEAEIDRTLDILRKQRVHFHARGEAGEHGDGGADTAAKDGDRVTVDFVGKIEGEVFQGGSAEDFASCWAKAACCRNSKRRHGPEGRRVEGIRSGFPG